MSRAVASFMGADCVRCGAGAEPDPACAPGRDEIFTVASFNVRVDLDPTPNTWEERLPRCRALLQEIDADLVGLQEPLIHQVESLIQDSDYAFIGGGRGDFKREGEFSCILYRRSRFEYPANGTFGLSEKPDVPGYRSWGSGWGRIVTWGLFRDKCTGREFIYYNTHLDNESEEARREGIKMVVAHAEEYAAGKPVILSGDFNAFPDSETYKTAASLLRDTRCISETLPGGAERSFHGYGKRTDFVKPIDFIFVSPEFRVLSYRTDTTIFDGRYASDHYPVVVKMML